MSLPCRHLRHENGERVTDEEVLAIVQQHDELMINLGCALEQRDELLRAMKALAGIPDPEKFVHDARFYSHETVTAIVKERDELMINLGCALEQRDELLRALKGLVDLDDGDESFAWDHEAEFEAGRAAIAKAAQS